MKKCSKCKEIKEDRDFYPKGIGNPGLNSWCKKCFTCLVRNNYLKRTYSIDEEQYQSLLKQQGGACAICYKKMDTFLPKHNRHKALAVDHDALTGKIRGILCENCNRGIGLFKHDTTLLKQAINYLNQF